MLQRFGSFAYVGLNISGGMSARNC